MEKTIDEKTIIITTKQILKDMKMKIHYLGFKYWITASVIILSDSKLNEKNIKMMDLYKMIAKKHKTTSNKVERALRYSYQGIKPKEYFNVSYSVNNTAFLFLLIDKIENSIK